MTRSRLPNNYRGLTNAISDLLLSLFYHFSQQIAIIFIAPLQLSVMQLVNKHPCISNNRLTSWLITSLLYHVHTLSCAYILSNILFRMIKLNHTKSLNAFFFPFPLQNITCSRKI